MAAMRKFISIVFSLSVLCSHTGRAGTYSAADICALEGSNVEVTFWSSVPLRTEDHDAKAEEPFWFCERNQGEGMDLRADPKYAGRVTYQFDEYSCSVRILDLRKSDSAVYRFSLEAKQPGGSFSASPGVKLSVTDLQVKWNEISYHSLWSCTTLSIECNSSCSPQGASYIWYKNGIIFKLNQKKFTDYFYDDERIACALRGHEAYHSPPVCFRGSSCDTVTYSRRNICAFTGSSVSISVTHKDNRVPHESLFILTDSLSRASRFVEIRGNVQFKGRISVHKGQKVSTLQIRNLEKKDSGEYQILFKWKTDWGLPGTTLTVTDPHVQVQVIRSPTGPKLICNSNCYPSHPAIFIWYKNDKVVLGETSFIYSQPVDPELTYFCSYENQRSPSVYGPRLASMWVSPRDVVTKNQMVLLTCNSDANPAAKFSWYKNNQSLLPKGRQLFFNSIQSSDSGEYHCVAENELGQNESEHIVIKVEHGPERCVISVSPAGEVEEGSSVTLTCSSDALPPATYTYFLENNTKLQEKESFYYFPSVRSDSKGSYHCQCENQYGQRNSTHLFLDVQYAPRAPTSWLLFSGELKQGTQVVLTCSSDANPAANYTWYKENEELPMASGQNFTIYDYKAEDSGNYYCMARNIRGALRSSLLPVGSIGSNKATAVGLTVTLLLVFGLFAALCWRRKNKVFARGQEQTADRFGQPDVGHTAENPALEEEELDYSTLSFSTNQQVVIYSNIRETQTYKLMEDNVEYAVVKYTKDKNEDFPVYSTVMKTKH